MIRIAREEDLPAMLAIYAPYVEDTTVSFEYVPPTPEEFRRRFLTVTAQFPWLVWEEDGQVLGYIYGSAPFERAAYGFCAESSIYLAPQAQGRGVGARLCRVLEELLRRQGYRLLYALVTTENTRSLKFHEKLGYREAACLRRCGYKFGRWIGVTWMEKELDPIALPSDFPAGWLSIVKNDENFQEILASLSLS